MSEPNYHTTNIFLNNLLATEIKRRRQISIKESFIEYALTDGNDKKLKSERDKKLYHKAKT